MTYTLAGDTCADQAHTAALNRKAFIELLFKARDLIPTDAQTKALGLDEDSAAWLGDSVALLNSLASKCGLDLCPYGWWTKRKTEPNYEQFKVVMDRVVMKALRYSKLELSFG